jgi:hypothetical protein
MKATQEQNQHNVVASVAVKVVFRTQPKHPVKEKNPKRQKGVERE